jgi:hypothetical protein
MALKRAEGTRVDGVQRPLRAPVQRACHGDRRSARSGVQGDAR